MGIEHIFALLICLPSIPYSPTFRPDFFPHQGSTLSHHCPSHCITACMRIPLFILFHPAAHVGQLIAHYHTILTPSHTIMTSSSSSSSSFMTSQFWTLIVDTYGLVSDSSLMLLHIHFPYTFHIHHIMIPFLCISHWSLIYQSLITHLSVPDHSFISPWSLIYQSLITHLSVPDHSFISPWSLIYQSLITIPHSAHVALSRSSSSHTLLLSILSLLCLHSHCSGHTSHCHGPSSYIGSQIVAGVSLALQFQEILSPSQPSCTVTDKQVVSFGRNSSTPLALLHSVLSLYCCYPFTQNESRPTLIEISPQFEAHLY